jgi:type IV pilus assembly protein PilO
VSLTAWTPRPEAADKFYARVPMEVKLTGRYHQVAKFFYLVGQLDRIINMEDISMREPKAKGDDVMLDVTALATAFHLIEPGADEEKQPPGGRRGRKAK